jgi:hypothetical protein
MEVYKRFFPEILLDNEEVYFAHLEGVLNSVDELASLEVIKTPEAYHFRLISSLPKYNEMLLQEILKLHNVFQIRLILSKSIKSSGTITFDISI